MCGTSLTVEVDIFHGGVGISVGRAYQGGRVYQSDENKCVELLGYHCMMIMIDVLLVI